MRNVFTWAKVHIHSKYISFHGSAPPSFEMHLLLRTFCTLGVYFTCTRSTTPPNCDVTMWSERSAIQTLRGLVLEADVRKQVLVGKLLTKSTRFISFCTSPTFYLREFRRFKFCSFLLDRLHQTSQTFTHLTFRSTMFTDFDTFAVDFHRSLHSYNPSV